MAHELDRLIAAFCAQPWAIDEARAMQLLAALEHRHAEGPRAEPYLDAPRADVQAVERRGKVAVLRLQGTIAPRASAVRDASSAFTPMDRFRQALRQVDADRSVQAIVLDVDSPGGMVDLVPETAAMLRGMRRAGRPIHAVANTMMASAAYWLCAQADKVFASPSAMVGSIGVRAMHVDRSEALRKAGIVVTDIHAGPRKVEGGDHRPLDPVARKALQGQIDELYDVFVADVAAGRGVDPAQVRADPEKAAAHMGGGRALSAQAALAMNMIDGIATLEEVIAQVGGPKGRLGVERERLALL